MRVKERFAQLHPLEEMEVALVRGSLGDPNLVNPQEEALVRTALSLARLYKV